MVEISDIDNRESLEAWLEGQPRQASVQVASRAAQRTLPLYWRWSLGPSARKRDLTALPILRSLLISSVAGTMPTEDIRAASAATSAASFAAASAADSSAASAAASAASFAAATAASAATSAASAAAADASFAAADASFAAVWRAVQQDCALLAEGAAPLTAPLTAPLWHGQDNPLADIWAETKTKVPQAEGDWAFWLAWYQSQLDGTPMPDQLLLAIAKIDPKTWDKGAQVLNPIVNEMWREYGAQDALLPALEPMERALERNAKVVRQQLLTLSVFVEEETRILRGRNTESDREAERMAHRIELLNVISSSVERMLEALDSPDYDTGSALVVIADNLPAIADKVEELDKDEGAYQTSAPIRSMAETIRHLTEAGTPGHVAVGMAAADVVVHKAKGILKKKPKKG